MSSKGKCLLSLFLVMICTYSAPFTDPLQANDAEPVQIRTGGKYWSSAYKSESLVGGKTVWIWPVQDEIITVNRTVSIKFHWRLRPGETLPKEEMWGGLLVSGAFVTAPLKHLDRGVKEGIVEYELDARWLEGEGPAVFLVGPVDASGIFTIPQGQPSSNLLTLKIKVVR